MQRSTLLCRLSSLALLAALLCSLAACQSTGAARQSLYVACAGGQSVVVYDIDPKAGTLTEVQRLQLPGKAGPLALSPDGEALYAALNSPPRLQPMTRDTATGELALLPYTEIEHFPTYLDIDATGRFAVTASYGAGVVSTYPIADDRRVGPALQNIATDKTAHACLIDPTNRFVYIPHTVPNAIYQFAFDAGRLKPNQPLVVRGGGTRDAPAGPRHYTYHPRLGIVYVVNELDSSVTAYQWDRKTGQLARFQSLATLPANFGGKNTCADIHITPDGKFLYASNRGHDSIAAYRLDADGLMSFIDTFPTQPVPREFAIDLNGHYLYAAGMRSSKLVAYAIDPRTGRLNTIGTYDTPETPLWVLVAEKD